MKTKLLFIVFNFLLLFMLQSCKRDNPCEGLDLSDNIVNYDFPDSIKSTLPYNGLDTLIFVSNLGDTATIIGQGKNQYYVEDKQGNNNANCPKTTINKYGNIDIIFQGNNQLLSVEYHIYKNSFSPKTLSGCDFIVNNQISLGSGYEYLTFYMPKQDSILLNGVYISGGYIEDNNYKILYNNQKGILKFINVNNKDWLKIK